VIAVVLFAACLGGCGYGLSDPSSTSVFTASSKQLALLTGGAPPPAATGALQSDTHNGVSNPTGAATDKVAAASFAPIAANQAKADAIKLSDAEETVDQAASLSAAPAQPAVEPHARVYLFRGIAGLIYSRGMDKLAERIERSGLSADVETYLMWRQTLERAIADYRRDPQPIVLIGHSMGGDAALSFAERLNGEGIPVGLLVTYDPSRIADEVPPNVERFINIYQSSNLMGGGSIGEGSRFHGHYASYNLKRHSEIIHVNIEKADAIQDQLVMKIRELAQTPAKAEGEAVPIRLEVPSDAAIELWDSGLRVTAHAGETLKTIAGAYQVPLWALDQINTVSEGTPLADGQRVIIPRHLVPNATPSPALVSYAPLNR